MKMNWITNFLYRRKYPQEGVVIYLDTDLLPEDKIQQIKQRMTPVFVEFSGSELKRLQMDDMKRAVTTS